MSDLFQLERLYRRDHPNGPTLTPIELNEWALSEVIECVRQLTKILRDPLQGEDQ